MAPAEGPPGPVPAPPARGPVRRAWRWTIGGLTRGVLRFRASLQVRVITSTLVVGTLALALLGGYLSGWIAQGLFDQRRTQLLEESARAAQGAQTSLTASATPTPAEIAAQMRELVTDLQRSGSGQPDVFLRRAPGDSPILVPDVVTDQGKIGLITPQLRAAVRTDDKQRWMSVAIVQTDEQQHQTVVPGIIVGSVVNLPAAGEFELYFLYSLESEQRTLEFVQRVLAAAAAGLVLLIGGMTWLVTRQAVRPVRAAARVAERLADGHLSERMTVHGVDEMATLARSFNDMAASLQDQIDRMEQMSALQRRFVSDVSHELRTPLTTIRMAAEVLHEARETMAAAPARSAELLTMQLDRFEDLLADLLEISRFDAGAAVLDAEARDVRDVLTRAVEQASPLADRRGVWLHVELPAAPVVADIDPRRVERILRNLLVNAIEHGEGRPVEARLGADGRAVAITVRDHGVGMSAEEVEHVFDRFWRADPARARTTGGTGLGLSIAIEDAHLHGGRLEAWGRPGQGAVFRLTLPLRAGLSASASPLPLVPQDRTPEPPVRRAALDPAGVPDLEPWEAS